MLTFVAHVKVDKQQINPFFTLLLLYIWFWRGKKTTIQTLTEYVSYYSPIHTASLCGEIQTLTGLLWLVTVPVGKGFSEWFALSLKFASWSV